MKHTQTAIQGDALKRNVTNSYEHRTRNRKWNLKETVGNGRKLCQSDHVLFWRARRWQTSRRLASSWDRPCKVMDPFTCHPQPQTRHTNTHFIIIIIIIIINHHSTSSLRIIVPHQVTIAQPEALAQLFASSQAVWFPFVDLQPAMHNVHIWNVLVQVMYAFELSSKSLKENASYSQLNLLQPNPDDSSDSRCLKLDASRTWQRGGFWSASRVRHVNADVADSWVF